ncbi:MAG: translation initiation factor IF-2, partial [Lachnospiraceae bacterium]|nr:translation initiation factor IF-2 [Lachnospiraceae bacterium]
ERPAGAGVRGERPVGQGRPASPFAAGRGTQTVPDKDAAGSGMRRPASSRPVAPRTGGGDFAGLVQKPSGKYDSKKTKDAKDSSASKYRKGDTDEMRRPGGKNAKTKGVKEVAKPVRPQQNENKEPEIKTITIPETLTLKELADAMKIQPSVIIKKLFLAGKIVTLNQDLDYDTAADIALDFDVVAEKEEQIDVIEELLKDSIEDRPEDLVPRPPVVCVMGHVDHGKTSLLDAIRKTSVTTTEAGGITQHIGAYTVTINGQKITFLDTPGHEAFTAMRMRGAQATDIAILVVAADDGVMPQTVEAINHAKAAGVEIVVAINKIDKPGANIDKVKKELSEYGLIGEEWGGTNIFVPVSAKRGDGIEDLLEMLLLVAEMHELKANPNRNARGLVIEAQLDNTRGPVATVLVQKGTLHVGDTVAAGSSFGKIRAMLDDKGKRVENALPGTPVEILGLSSVPSAGEIFIATKNEKDARAYAETFIAEGRKKLLEETKSKMSLDDLFSQIKAGNVKELNLIVKADVQGSVEAVKSSLLKLSNDEVVIKVIHSGAGNISESDVMLASASNAVIIGFNVRPDNQARSVAEQEKVDIRLYDVIYKVIEDMEAAMIGMLDPVFEEQITGHAVVRQVFKASGIGNIAGCFVLDGKIQRGSSCRITRGKDQLFDGKITSLKRFKDDVKEVAAGYECGMVFDGFGDFLPDDTMEIYMMVEVPRQKVKKN